MSAECSNCGADIVYPEDTWPVGECRVCDRREAVRTSSRITRIEAWDEHGNRVASTHWTTTKETPQ